MSSKAGGQGVGMHWSLLPILFVPVLLSLWRPDAVTPDTERPVPPAKADYYIRDAQTQVMSTDGQVQYRIRANEVLHFPDQSARLSSVRLQYQGEGTSNWMLSAATGFVPPPGEESRKLVQLAGGVEIKGQRGDTTDPADATQLLTDYATIYPESGRLQTDALVEMREPGIYARAIGMTVDTRNNRLALASQVRVLYERYALP